jgi:CheY-like chemotaxis protein
MDSETQARIFDPFYTTKSPNEGTGMGLAVCQNIIRDLDGTIEVRSAPGEGTTFTVSLPAVASREPACSVPDLSAERPGRGLRVLIIDDEPAVCRMLERTLPASFEIHVFQRAGDALAAVENGLEIDVVLSDLLMPNESGARFYSRLTELAPQFAEHVVFMTGGAFMSRVQEFVQETDLTVLQKPCDTDELVHALEVAASDDGLSAAS